MSFLWNAGTGTPDGVVDNFEDSPDGPYASGETLTDYYGGNLSQFSRQTGTVVEGSTALQADSDGPNYVISSTSGLPRYPSQGETFQTRIRFPDQASRAGPLWATQSEAGNSSISGYHFWITPNNDDIRLRRYDNGSVTNLDTQTVTVPTGEWLRAEITWGTDNSMSCILYDSSDTQLASVSATDSNYTSGGIGWHTTVQGSGSTYHDAFEVTS